MAGALPRGTPHDEHLFDLLNRAYIDARYSKAYRITREELVELLERVRDLARRTLRASSEELGSFVSPEAVGPLPELPHYGQGYVLPEPPDLSDADAVEDWRQRVAKLAESRALAERQAGLHEGKEEGLREGKEEGKREELCSVCELLGIELSAARRATVEASSLAQLESLLATLKTRRAWPEE